MLFKVSLRAIGVLVGLSTVTAMLAIAWIPRIPNAQSVITVNTTDDEAMPGDGTCRLREAINNGNASGDT